jgi:hypothetical protein
MMAAAELSSKSEQPSNPMKSRETSRTGVSSPSIETQSPVSGSKGGTKLRRSLQLPLVVSPIGLTLALVMCGSVANYAHAKAPARTVLVKSAVFKPACTRPSYPVPAPSASPAIDSQCGLAGSGTGPEGQQNMSKNDFCATGTPQLITIDYLTSLQKRVEANPSINFGSEDKGTRKRGPTINRAPLQKLGEGKLVTLKAFVLIARQEGAESVNCEKNVPDQPAFHDIHISLVASSAIKDECAGVVAEMSPHHRPDSWTQRNVEKLAGGKLPVRVTGHLYFDSSHFPCANDQTAGEGNPKRVSLWEIHPIYKFEVCTANCTGAGTWIPLDQWVRQHK